jgi:hypothetical protein
MLSYARATRDLRRMGRVAGRPPARGTRTIRTCSFDARSRGSTRLPLKMKRGSGKTRAVGDQPGYPYYGKVKIGAVGRPVRRTTRTRPQRFSQFELPFLAHIIHEGFYCNCGYAAATSQHAHKPHAGGRAHPSRPRRTASSTPRSLGAHAPVSLGVSTVSSRTPMNNGRWPRLGGSPLLRQSSF